MDGSGTNQKAESFCGDSRATALLTIRAAVRRWSLEAGVLLLILLPTLAVADANNDLIKAVKKGDLAAVEALLDKGADPLANNKKGVNALTLAKREGHPEILELLRTPRSTLSCEIVAVSTPQESSCEERSEKGCSHDRPERVHATIPVGRRPCVRRDLSIVLRSLRHR